MERKWYVGLLAVCLLSLTLIIVAIGLLATSPPNEAEPSLAFISTFLLANLLGFIGWVWGIVLTVQNRHWVWLVFNILIGPLSAAVYSVVRLKSGPDTGERYVA